MARPDLNEVYTQELRSKAASMLRERGLPLDGDNLQRAMMLLTERPDIGDDIAAAQSPQMSSQLLHYIDSGSTSTPAQPMGSTKADAAASEPARGERVPVPQQKPSRSARSNDDTGEGEDAELPSEAATDEVADNATAAKAGTSPSNARRPIEDAIEQQLGETATSAMPPNARGEPMDTDQAPPTAAASREFDPAAVQGGNNADLIKGGLVSLLALLGLRARRPSQAVIPRDPGFTMRGAPYDPAYNRLPAPSPRQLESTNMRRAREGADDRRAARNDPRATDMEGGY